MFAVKIENLVFVIITAVYMSSNLALASDCPVPCIHGFCVSGDCECESGFAGPPCDLGEFFQHF